MEPWIKPVTLAGRAVTLLPLELSHIAGLREAARDGELWQLWYTSVPDPEQTESYVRTALELQAAHSALPFVVLENASQTVIGTTRYCNVDQRNQRLEIGYTWYAQRFQRTGVNTECKLLLLTHAFEQLGSIAVEFRTHWHNQPSRTAIARLGARQDGVLRQHQRGADGAYRDTVVFSILNSEWPTVKKHLEYKQLSPR
ncbi:MAG: GNAT family N-acetyltransferase [Herpetosiphonaceae bacterium]|nr:GNAT family N-acetyltransferase [Herpetosiphonaceae bacterium]